MKLVTGLFVTIVLLAAGAYAVVEMNDIDDPGPQASRPTTIPTTGATPTPVPSESQLVRGDCSAGDSQVSAYDWPEHGVPVAVERTRNQIITAAIACDYQALEEIALAEGEGFSFSFGADESPARFWRQRERDARRIGEATSEYMRYLVSILDLPYCKESAPDGSVYYVWPRVHCSARTTSDWDDLTGLYTDEQIESMRTGDSYLGFRVGILEDGDWVYFIAGD